MTLLARLRAATRSAHGDLEQLLGRPGTIHGIDDYASWLSVLLGIHAPLEAALAGAGGWPAPGIDPGTRLRTPALIADLAALGRDPARIPRAPAGALPALPGLEEALGALYVLEGSTLGGRVIAREMRHRLGPAVEPALTFFDGRGEAAGPAWRSFCAALDRHGAACPAGMGRVVCGAVATFAAYISWFSNARAEAAA